MPIRHDDPFEESEVLSSRREHPDEIHNHYYTQRKNSEGNGNGNGALLKISLAVSGFLIVGLLSLNAYLWRDNAQFQRDVIDRLARIEERQQ